MVSFKVFAFFSFLFVAVAFALPSTSVHQESPEPEPIVGTKPADGGVDVLPASDTPSRIQSSVSDRSSKKGMKEEAVGSKDEIILKTGGADLDADSEKELQTSGKLSMSTSSRVSCGSLSRCNYSRFTTRCYTYPSTIWYARYFTRSGSCIGKLYISSNRICIRPGSVHCCALVYYIRA